MDKTKPLSFFPPELPQPDSSSFMLYEGEQGEEDTPFILYAWENVGEAGFKALDDFFDTLIDTVLTGWTDPTPSAPIATVKLSDLKGSPTGTLNACAFILAETNNPQ